MPVAEAELYLGDGGVEDGLVPPIDGLCLGHGQQFDCTVDLTEAGGEDATSASPPQQTSRKGVGNRLPGQHLGGLPPTTETSERLGSERVEIAIEPVKAGQAGLGDCVE